MLQITLSSMARFFGPSTSLASQSSLDIIKEDGDNDNDIELAAITAGNDRQRHRRCSRRRSSSLCRRGGNGSGGCCGEPSPGGHRRAMYIRQGSSSGGGGSVGARNRDEYEDLSSIDDDHPWRPPMDNNNGHTDDVGGDNAKGGNEGVTADDGDGDGSGGRSKGAQGWRNVRAVMAYYCTLRKIKREVAFIAEPDFFLGVICSCVSEWVYIVCIWLSVDQSSFFISTLRFVKYLPSPI